MSSARTEPVERKKKHFITGPDAEQDKEPHCVYGQEDIDELLKSDEPLGNCIFLDVTFTADRLESLKHRGIEDAEFWGCVFPQDYPVDELRSLCRSVSESERHQYPFKTYRSTMYTQEELSKVDAEILHFIAQRPAHIRNLHLEKAKLMHDLTVKEALLRHVKDKVIIGVMGGHAMKRASKEYENIVKLTKHLADLGFCIICGGGPGAMEAANFGGYLRGRKDEEVTVALQLLRETPAREGVPEWADKTPALAVVARLGPPSNPNNIGIPTYIYEDEPSNVFATHVCKMFTRAIRQDTLVAIANGGCIFNPGSFGTRMEVFEFSCLNSDFKSKRPMVFLGEQFWRENPVVQIIRDVAKETVVVSDNIHIITQAFEEFRVKGCPPCL